VLLRDILKIFDLENMQLPEDISEEDMVSYIVLNRLKRFAKK
jgi:hypothetical protein